MIRHFLHYNRIIGVHKNHFNELSAETKARMQEFIDEHRVNDGIGWCKIITYFIIFGVVISVILCIICWFVKCIKNKANQMKLNYGNNIFPNTSNGVTYATPSLQNKYNNIGQNRNLA